ncbi:MAG: hypothetical protein N3C63_12040 [Rhodocyclaceae bacterium]|nr:hypothetical protein [Rhodocyclaceae bacterium]
MKHKVKRIHFVGSERTQSRSRLLGAAARPLAAHRQSRREAR